MPSFLVHISEVYILLICNILKSVHKRLIMCLLEAFGGKAITLLVLRNEVPAEEEDVDDEQRVAAEMGGKGDEVAGGVPGEEDLGACTKKLMSVIFEKEKEDSKTYRWRFQWPR